MGYISAQQAATKWGISKRRVQVLCTENRIKNATRIGNMWVVPEDALKPADGRVQTHHTVESPTARAARTALKKLTVNAYQEINGKLNNPSTSKMVFVSLLATTIFCDIQNDESSNEKDDVFLMISSELLEIEFKESSRRSFWEMFSSLVSDFEKYIYRYADYVDDILSWAYQYVNKLSLDSGLESTQFFTEEYMIEYLTKGIPRTTTASSVYLDPACGGGNFLSHILNQLFVLRYRELDNPIACIENIFNALYGYELDPNLAAVASVNLKLKALMLLAKVQQVSTVDWRLFCPNIFTSVEPNGFVFDYAGYANERDHVQKIVEQHYWLFGEQYHLVTADKRMQKALEEYLYLLYGDKAPNPVLTPDEEELRRMDIFACAARNTEDANGSAIQENLVVELKAPKVVLTKAVLRQIEDYMDYVRKQPLFNSQYRRWKFIAVCSAVDDDVKARYDSQKSKGKKGLVAEIDNYEVYALTWDDVFQSFDLRHAFLLDKLKMDEEAIAAEIAQTAGDEKSKDTADALTALVAN